MFYDSYKMPKDKMPKYGSECNALTEMSIALSDFDRVDIGLMKNKIFTKVYAMEGKFGVVFENEKERFVLCHNQDCCEEVWLEDICGELDDLKNARLLQCEVSHSGKKPNSASRLQKGVDSFTWTFYKFATQRGRVTLRFFGSSNGYYSEEIDINYQRIDYDKASNRRAR